MRKIVDSRVLNKLVKPDSKSHKGQNGRVLVIAGSNKFHGALLFTVQAASRVVDMVYVHSIEKNREIVEKLKTQMAAFIGVRKNELLETVKIVDVVIIGPGLEESVENRLLVEKILKDFPKQKVVIDATAFWHLNPELLHKNCIVTPHSREFENTFACKASPENVLAMAKKYQALVVLTGPTDYISDGHDLYENNTGNVGMTKGGTGDVLVGLVGAIFTKNEALTAALAGTYLNGLAGDELYKEKGTFYNAEDLIDSLGRSWGKLTKRREVV